MALLVLHAASGVALVHPLRRFIRGLGRDDGGPGARVVSTVPDAWNDDEDVLHRQDGHLLILDAEVDPAAELARLLIPTDADPSRPGQRDDGEQHIIVLPHLIEHADALIDRPPALDLLERALDHIARDSAHAQIGPGILPFANRFCVVPWIHVLSGTVQLDGRVPQWLCQRVPRIGKPPRPIAVGTVATSGAGRSRDFLDERLIDALLLLRIASARTTSVHDLLAFTHHDTAPRLLTWHSARIDAVEREQREARALDALLARPHGGTASAGAPAIIPDPGAIDGIVAAFGRALHDPPALVAAAQATAKDLRDAVDNFVNGGTLAGDWGWSLDQDHPMGLQPVDLGRRIARVGPRSNGERHWPGGFGWGWPAHAPPREIAEVEAAFRDAMETNRTLLVGTALRDGLRATRQELDELERTVSRGLVRTLQGDALGVGDTPADQAIAATLWVADQLEQHTRHLADSTRRTPASTTRTTDWQAEERRLVDDAAHHPSDAVIWLEAIAIAFVAFAIAIAFWWTIVIPIVCVAAAVLLFRYLRSLRMRQRAGYLGDASGQPDPGSWQHARSAWLKEANGWVDSEIANAEAEVKRARLTRVEELRQRIHAVRERVKVEIEGIASLVSTRRELLRAQQREHDAMRTRGDAGTVRVGIDTPAAAAALDANAHRDARHTILDALRKLVAVDAPPERIDIAVYEGIIARLANGGDHIDADSRRRWRDSLAPIRQTAFGSVRDDQHMPNLVVAASSSSAHKPRRVVAEGRFLADMCGDTPVETDPDPLIVLTAPSHSAIFARLRPWNLPTPPVETNPPVEHGGDE